MKTTRIIITIIGLFLTCVTGCKKVTVIDTFEPSVEVLSEGQTVRTGEDLQFKILSNNQTITIRSYTGAVLQSCKEVDDILNVNTETSLTSGSSTGSYYKIYSIPAEYLVYTSSGKESIVLKVYDTKTKTEKNLEIIFNTEYSEHSIGVTLETSTIGDGYNFVFTIKTNYAVSVKEFTMNWKNGLNTPDFDSSSSSSYAINNAIARTPDNTEVVFSADATKSYSPNSENKITVTVPAGKVKISNTHEGTLHLILYSDKTKASRTFNIDYQALQLSDIEPEAVNVNYQDSKWGTGEVSTTQVHPIKYDEYMKVLVSTPKRAGTGFSVSSKNGKLLFSKTEIETGVKTLKIDSWNTEGTELFIRGMGSSEIYGEDEVTISSNNSTLSKVMKMRVRQPIAFRIGGVVSQETSSHSYSKGYGTFDGIFESMQFDFVTYGADPTAIAEKEVASVTRKPDNIAQEWHPVAADISSFPFTVFSSPDKFGFDISVHTNTSYSGNMWSSNRNTSVVAYGQFQGTSYKSKTARRTFSYRDLPMDKQMSVSFKGGKVSNVAERVKAFLLANGFTAGSSKYNDAYNEFHDALSNNVAEFCGLALMKGYNILDNEYQLWNITDYIDNWVDNYYRYWFDLFGFQYNFYHMTEHNGFRVEVDSIDYDREKYDVRYVLYWYKTQSNNNCSCGGWYWWNRVDTMPWCKVWNE